MEVCLEALKGPLGKVSGSLGGPLEVPRGFLKGPWGVSWGPFGPPKALLEAPGSVLPLKINAFGETQRFP